MNFALCPFYYNYNIFQSFKKILSNDYPDYYDVWQKFTFYDETNNSWILKYTPNNVFYTDARSFNEYCEWLFDILFKLRHSVGDIEGVPNDKRYCALIGERIMTTYLERNKKFYMPTYGIGASTPLYALISRTAHKLKLNINAKYYSLIRDFFRKYTHYRPAVSSWAKE